jgi:nucleoside-diphosphate-sugar epimerase
MNLLGLFIPVMSELKEMRYQYEQDYIFNSDKFEKRFGFKPTSYEAGIDTIIAADYS